MIQHLLKRGIYMFWKNINWSVETCAEAKTIKKQGVCFFGLYLAPKMKNFLTVDEFGIVQEHKTFRSLKDSQRPLYPYQYFQMIEVKKISAMLPKSWKKSFNSGIIIRTKKKIL